MPTQLDDAVLVTLYVDRGMEGRVVAREMGVCHQRVFRRLKELGIQRKSGPRGLRREKNPNWKGGRYVDGQGYVRVRVDGGYDYEHRVIAAAARGYGLTPGEVVHHDNHERSDNEPENLQPISSQSEHMCLHMDSDEGRRRQALSPHGEDSPHAKITETDVAAILDAVSGGETHRSIAKRFGISKSQVTRIANGKSWKRAILKLHYSA